MTSRALASELRTASVVVEAEALSVTFRGGAGVVTAIEDLSLHARPSEVLALVGPSGAGKTTILNVLAGLVAPTSGRVRVGGLEPVAYRKSCGLGFCFQQPVLFEWRNVLQNILLPAQVRGVEDRRIARERGLHLLELVGLTRFKDASPSELSGGMRQRASLCRALVLQPQLLLLDEPFSAVDALTRQALWVDLRTLWADTKPTTLLVTHSVEEAVFLADRVLVLSHSPGRLVGSVEIALSGKRKPSLLLAQEFYDLTMQVRRLIDPS